MSHRYLAVDTNSARYCVPVHELTKLMQATTSVGPDDFIKLESIADFDPIYIRVSAIECFFISTPEGRESYKKWTKEVNEEEEEDDEPWRK